MTGAPLPTAALEGGQWREDPFSRTPYWDPGERKFCLMTSIGMPVLWMPVIVRAYARLFSKVLFDVLEIVTLYIKYNRALNF